MAEGFQSVLIDTNLLLLLTVGLTVGLFDPKLIGQKRLEGYTRADFEEIRAIFDLFPKRLTTPHVLSEVGNLGGQCIPTRDHAGFRDFFGRIVARLDEQWIPAIELTTTNAFARLGLADAAIAQLADQRATVFSVDLNLCVLLAASGVEVENFNHWRRL